MKGLLIGFIGVAVIAVIYILITGDLNAAGNEAMQRTVNAGSIVP